MKIAIVGAGFVGEATGRGLLKHKHEVVFIDKSKEKIAALEKGGLTPICQSSMQRLLQILLCSAFLPLPMAKKFS